MPTCSKGMGPTSKHDCVHFYAYTLHPLHRRVINCIQSQWQTYTMDPASFLFVKLLKCRLDPSSLTCSGRKCHAVIQRPGFRSQFRFRILIWKRWNRSSGSVPPGVTTCAGPLLPMFPQELKRKLRLRGYCPCVSSPESDRYISKWNKVRTHEI